MKGLIFPIVALCASHAFGVRTNTLVNGASDWDDPGNYVDTSFVPGKRDVVIIPSSSTNFLYSTDSGSLDVATNLSAVILEGFRGSSALVVDVAEGCTNALGCSVFGGGQYTSVSWENGELIKRGAGLLDLDSIGKSVRGPGADYFTGIRIEEGALRLPQTCNNDDGARNAEYCQVGYVIIEEDATFIPAKYPGNSSRGVTYVRGVSGAGTLQGQDSAYWFVVQGASPHGPFSGKVTGNLRPRIDSSGTLELTGTESTGFGYPYFHRLNGGTLGARKFGNKFETSSLGYTKEFQVLASGGRLVYMGEGESSDRDFKILSWEKPFYLDGGAHGGLVLTGLLTNEVNQVTSPKAMRGMVFTGSNETACVFAGAIESSSLLLDGVNYALYMSKEGSGTWRFADNPERENANGFAVRQGTLQFDSLLEAGLVCSLGVATNLTDGYMGTYDSSRAEDYAFNLGGTAASGDPDEPVFEYVGGTGVVCTTRPIALSGNARIKNDTARAFRFKGVSGLGNGSKTLTLTGSNSGQNEISGISDGTGGKVGVKKTGSGTWRLSGDLTFTGGIAVEGGRLVVVNPATNVYSWYRWTIKELVSETGTATYCSEFGLFDKSDMRQNVGLKTANYVSDIQPGEVSTEFPVDSYPFKETNTDTGMPDCMFNHKYQDYGMYINPHPFTGERKQWLAFTMRLTNGAPEIATFDYIYPFKNPHTLAPKSYTIEGSLNGLEWDELYVTNSACSPHNSTFRWQATGGVLVSSSYEHAGGFPIRGYSLREFDVLENAGTLSVSSGGVFEVEGDPVLISGLSVDSAVGGGTIKNVKFAEEDGELEVAGITGSDTVALSLAFDGCEGVESISGWSLSLDGEPSARKIGVRNGVVCVLAKGFAVMVR